MIVISCGSSSSSNSSTVTPTTNTPTTTTSTKKTQLFLGTGEYETEQAWDAVLRFDDVSAVTASDIVTPSGTVPLKTVKGTTGPNLNFGHGMFLYESRDELFVASLFTTEGTPSEATKPDVEAGSVGILSNASTIDGSPTLTRHIFGSNTGFNKPHGLWVDTTKDILYVANTFASKISVFDTASTVDGNVAPDRTFQYNGIGFPVHLYSDVDNDRLFVVVMQSSALNIFTAAVLIYNNASTLSGEVVPNVRIFGTNTRLDEGNNQTTHNVMYDKNSKILFVGHHTNEVLMYDLSAVDLTPTTAVDLDLTPRVLKINDKSGDSDKYDWSCYGIFHLASTDTLYVSCGNTIGGTDIKSGPPNNGAAAHVIKVYKDISDTSKSGLVTPDQKIYWSNVSTYYPPQPLWVIEKE